MTWISYLFFAACLCSVSGTLVMLEWKLLLPILERWRPNLLASLLKLMIFQYLCPVVFIIMIYSRMDIQKEIHFNVLFITTSLIGVVMKVLGAVWILVILLKLPGQVKMFLRDREILKGNVPVEMEGAEELFREVCRDLGIRRKIGLYANDECYSPVRIRIVRPAVLLPYGMEYEKKELRMVFIHELTHYLHHDLAYKIACFVIQILHWFNPSVKNLLKHYEEWAETACDVSACEKGKPHFTMKEYSLMLLGHIEEETGKTIQGSGFFLYDSKNELERRIERLKMMEKKKGQLPKVLVAMVAMVMFVGNSVPAFAASDILTNGYEDIYENTSNLRMESQEILIPAEMAAYEVNEDGEIEIPADQVNPEGWPEITLDGNMQQRTIKTYGWDIPANTYGRSFGFSCKSGGKIAIIVNCDHTIQAGIIEPNGDRRCVVDSGIFSHTFQLDQTGTYRFYVKNTNSFEISLEASVTY